VLGSGLMSMSAEVGTTSGGEAGFLGVSGHMGPRANVVES
jgi:hypothetical protein